MISAKEAKAIYDEAHKNDAALIEWKKKHLIKDAEDQLEKAVRLGLKSIPVSRYGSIDSANEHICFDLTEEDFKAFKDAGYDISFGDTQCQISWIK